MIYIYINDIYIYIIQLNITIYVQANAKSLNNLLRTAGPPRAAWLVLVLSQALCAYIYIYIYIYTYMYIYIGRGKGERRFDEAEKPN